MSERKMNAFGEVDGDWKYAVEVACRDLLGGTPAYQGDRSAFDVGDVAEVFHRADGENDGDDWVAVVRLADGRIACISAGCDFTGWGCQDSGAVTFAVDVEDAIRFGLDKGHRQRMGLPEPKDTGERSPP